VPALSDADEVYVGTTPAPETVTIPVGELHLTAPADATPAPGQRSSGVNPVRPYAVEPGTVTEQEFTFALSIDATYSTTYELRVTNAAEPIPGLSTAVVSVGAAPATLVSPAQQDGVDVASLTDPSAATTATQSGTTTYALIAPTDQTAPTTESAPTATSATTYPLLASAAATEPALSDADEVYVGTVGAAGPGTIHNPGGSTVSGQCGACHQTHTAPSQNLSKAPSETEQCYTCHAGGVGGADVRAQYALGQPANDPATRSYYSHDTTDPGDHSLDSQNEFAGKLTRHSQCSDCHDPHGATTTKSVMQATGWTAPGGFTKVSGVAVTNGAAGSVPSYTWLDGMVQPVTAEYQLCFKCHSGFTTLPDDVPGKPSQSFTDLSVDFNPANKSYHPIEAPGVNQTQKLADSLDGGSSYKLWKFKTTDTVRCVSCHASNTTGTSSDPAQNAPDATLTVHASTNRGILIRPYENRVLSKAGQFYDAKGAALCLTCHMEEPFMNRYRPAAATATNFVFHGLHMTGISAKGSGGLDIDTPGAGQGNARCAECHFSSHGTTQLPNGQNVAGDRLVGFSPNVLASKSVGGVPTFTKTATGGTCTLTCHGEDHQAASYTN
jgi:predicted CXXCH cytochrome family protein